MPKVLIFESKKRAESTIALNKIIKIKIDEKIICLTRTIHGYFAFEKDCPHMSDDLSRGNINNQNEIVCPWHAYRFNLNSGEECERRCKALLTFSVFWDQERLWIKV